MKDIVTFETAKRLRDAGFPQPGYPTPDPVDVMGRVMYDADGDKFMCFWQEEDGGGDILLTPFMHNKQECKNPLVFAPTATDIMRELWFRFSLKFGGNGKWIVLQTKDLNDREDQITTDTNPAEAAAQAWLSVNEK